MSRRVKNGKSATSPDPNEISANSANSGTTRGTREKRIAQLKSVCAECVSSLKDGSKDYQSSSLSELKTYYFQQRKAYCRRIVLLIFTCLILSVGVFWIFSYTQLAGALFRLVLIKTKPVWDWSYLHEPPCFLENHSLESAPLSDAHCVVCEDLAAIPERAKGKITPFQIGEDFLVEDLPLLIRKGADLKSGPVDLSLGGVLQHHREDKTLVPCKLRTNLKTKTAFNFDAMLRKVLRPDMESSWFAFWELCRHENVREARAVVPRPAELPLMLEVDDSIWFFTARKFNALVAKQVDITAPVFFLSQFVGSSKIRLIPRPPCQTICRELETIMQPGDFLLFTNELFDFGWMPGNESEVLAVGAGAK